MFKKKFLLVFQFQSVKVTPFNIFTAIVKYYNCNGFFLENSIQIAINLSKLNLISNDMKFERTFEQYVK